MIIKVVEKEKGKIIMMLGEWKMILMLMEIMEIVVGMWELIRMKEKIKVRNRRKIKMKSKIGGLVIVIKKRVEMLYMMGKQLIIGEILGYIN